MERTFFRELVLHSRVNGEEVNIMHGDVVTVNVGLQETHVEERGSVETKIVYL